MSTDVAFFETTPFSLSSIVTSQVGDDDLLVYTVFLLVPTLSPTPIFTALTHVPIKPLITQVYSRRYNPPFSSPTSTALSSDPVQNDDLPIAHLKVNVSVRTQFLCLFPIAICRLPLSPLLHLLILFLFLALSMRLYLTQVGVMLWWMKCRP